MVLRRLWRGAVAATLLLGGLAAPSFASQSVKTWTTGGIRKQQITVVEKDRTTVGGRLGTRTTTEVYTFWNVRDAVQQVIARSGLSASTADENALVEGVKNGKTTIGQLDDLLGGPRGIPGTRSLPAGFHGHDPATWRQMGFDSGDFTGRYNAAVAALGVPFTGSSLADAQAFVNRMIAEGKLQAWNFATIFNAVGWDFDFGSYTSPEDSYLKGIMGGGPPHFVPVVADGPGSPLEMIFHDFGERSAFNAANPAQAYIAVAYFLSESQRWIQSRSLLFSLGAGGLANQAFDRARDDAGILSASGDPLVLDLNLNKFVDVTGKSPSSIRAKKNRGFVEKGSVHFDLYGTGPIKMEWLRGNGDGFLAEAVRVKSAMQQKRNLTGRDLFGDAEGYPGGFGKLLQFDKNRDGKIAGAELEALCIWIDSNQDAEMQPTEFKTLSELKISEIGVKPRIAYNRDQEPMEVSYFVQGGQKRLMQEVWFALEPKQMAKGGR